MLKKILFVNRNLLFPYENIRYMIRFIRDNYKANPGLIGAEVGIQQADNSISILKHLDVKQLYLIDSFVEYDGYGDKFSDEFDTLELIVRKRIKKYKDKAVLIKDFSHNAAKRFKDGFFDFVYIDANHSFDFVRQDIELWYPKVKSGGIFGGHDFNSRQIGVFNAVMEFIDEMGFDLNFYDNDWWICK